jgi:hypothetical protein
MVRDLMDIVIRWNNNTSERQKLQHTYLVVTVAVILIAGVVSLVRADLGHDIMIIALIALGAFLANALVWNLLSSVVLAKLTARTPSTPAIVATRQPTKKRSPTKVN